MRFRDSRVHKVYFGWYMLRRACAIATSIVHSKLDYFNSLYYKLLKSQWSRFQQIHNSLVRIDLLQAYVFA